MLLTLRLLTRLMGMRVRMNVKMGGGIGTDSESGSTATRRKSLRKGGTWFAKYQQRATLWNRPHFGQMGKVQPTLSNGGGQTKEITPKYACIDWDVAPTQEYFDELFRVSRNQIIWGANYFWMPPTRCFVIWRKLSISEGFSMAMCEYAWTSFNDNAKVFECAPQGDIKDPRFHPTQKPIKLYEWLLGKYAKQGDKILDTHGGSMSSMIACHRGGFTATCIEIDEFYFNKARQRLIKEQQQLSLF